MSETLNAKLNFNTEEGGTAESSTGFSVNVLQKENSLKPYDMLLMALGSCMYATFEEVFKKMRISCESTDIEIEGEKREEVPKFLKYCRVKFKVKGADNQKKFERAFDLAAKYCSIFQTLSRVAEMSTEIEFTEQT